MYNKNRTLGNRTLGYVKTPRASARAPHPLPSVASTTRCHRPLCPRKPQSGQAHCARGGGRLGARMHDAGRQLVERVRCRPALEAGLPVEALVRLRAWWRRELRLHRIIHVPVRFPQRRRLLAAEAVVQHPTLLPVRNDIAGVLSRMQPRCQRFRGSSQLYVQVGGADVDKAFLQRGRALRRVVLLRLRDQLRVCGEEHSPDPRKTRVSRARTRERSGQVRGWRTGRPC